MSKTANQLIIDAYLQTGMIPQESGDAVPPYLISQGLILLNDIIAEWGGMSNHIPYQKVITFDLVANQESYTFGLGGSYDINTEPLIDIIEMTFFINNNPPDNIKFTVLPMTEFEYGNIVYTNVNTYPSQYLLRVFPDYSEIKLQPRPQSSYPMTIVCKQRLQPVELRQNLQGIFPLGFLLCLKYRLMMDIADSNGFDLPVSFIQKAQNAISAMKGNNKQNLGIVQSETINSGPNNSWWGIYWAG